MNTKRYYVSTYYVNFDIRIIKLTFNQGSENYALKINNENAINLFYFPIYLFSNKLFKHLYCKYLET